MGVLITGESRGMGMACAIAWSREAPAVAVDHLANVGAANEVVETIEANGGSAFAVKANIAGQALIVDGEFTAIQMRHDVGEGSDRS